MAKTGAAKRESRTTQRARQKLQAVQGAPHSAREIDRLIHERLRLGIISALAGHPSLTFNELKHAVKTSDGNLSVHARKLEDAGYINCAKSFDGRTPRTEYSLTERGQLLLPVIRSMREVGKDFI